MDIIIIIGTPIPFFKAREGVISDFAKGYRKAWLGNS